MKLNQLSISFSGDEITKAVQTAAARASTAAAQVPPELSTLAVAVKKDCLVISAKKKIGFLPVTISAEIRLRPTFNGDGIVITVSKISAGFIGSEAVAAQLLSQVGRSLTGIPGCSVNGNDITLTKEALAAKVPWLDVPGTVNRFGISGDTLEIAIG